MAALLNRRRMAVYRTTARRIGAKWGETFNDFGGSICTSHQRGASHMDSAHISALQAKHSGLDRRIADEFTRPLPDMSLVATLKKQKLKIKEALASVLR
jgi:hypothetical protein